MQNFMAMIREKERRAILRKEDLPVLAAVAGNVVWGFSFLFTRVATQGAPVPVVLSARFLFAFLTLNILNLKRKEKLLLRREDRWWLLAMTVRGWIYFNLESYGIFYTSATMAGVILAATPVVAMLLGALCLGERPTVRQCLFSPLPVLGVALIAFGGDPIGEIRPVGILLLLGASLVSALGTVINRRLAKGYSAFVRTYLNVTGCAVGFTVQALVSVGGDLGAYLAPLAQREVLLPVLALGLLCSVGCEMMVNWAAGYMTAGQLAPFQSIETLVSMGAGVVLLGEPLSAVMAAGAGLILLGVWQITKKPKVETGQGRDPAAEGSGS